MAKGVMKATITTMRRASEKRVLKDVSSECANETVLTAIAMSLAESSLSEHWDLKDEEENEYWNSFEHQ
jgi:hypothetical protein